MVRALYVVGIVDPSSKYLSATCLSLFELYARRRDQCFKHYLFKHYWFKLVLAQIVLILFRSTIYLSTIVKHCLFEFHIIKLYVLKLGLNNLCLSNILDFLRKAPHRKIAYPSHTANLSAQTTVPWTQRGTLS